MILQSITQRQIAIADTIISCKRHDCSSEDSKLIERIYNRQGVQTLIENGVTKIICTSKGVLKDLEKQIVCYSNNPLGQIDIEASANFQSGFVRQLGGNNNEMKNPIARVFSTGNVQVTALASPSPGSPQ